jgi:hypothetical protein
MPISSIVDAIQVKNGRKNIFTLITNTPTKFHGYFLPATGDSPNMQTFKNSIDLCNDILRNLAIHPRF